MAKTPNSIKLSIKNDDSDKSIPVNVVTSANYVEVNHNNFNGNVIDYIDKNDATILTKIEEKVKSISDEDYITIEDEDIKKYLLDNNIHKNDNGKYSKNDLLLLIVNKLKNINSDDNGLKSATGGINDAVVTKFNTITDFCNLLDDRYIKRISVTTTYRAYNYSRHHPLIRSLESEALDPIYKNSRYEVMIKIQFIQGVQIPTKYISNIVDGLFMPMSRFNIKYNFVTAEILALKENTSVEILGLIFDYDGDKNLLDIDSDDKLGSFESGCGYFISNTPITDRDKLIQRDIIQNLNKNIVLKIRINETDFIYKSITYNPSSIINRDINWTSAGIPFMFASSRTDFTYLKLSTNLYIGGKTPSDIDDIYEYLSNMICNCHQENNNLIRIFKNELYYDTYTEYCELLIPYKLLDGAIIEIYINPKNSTDMILLTTTSDQYYDTNIKYNNDKNIYNIFGKMSINTGTYSTVIGKFKGVKMYNLNTILPQGYDIYLKIHNISSNLNPNNTINSSFSVISKI